MKYNQYAYVETDFDHQVKELTDINFLPKNYADWSFSDLLAKLIKMTIAEAKTDAAKTAKLVEFAVSNEQTLPTFCRKSQLQSALNNSTTLLYNCSATTFITTMI